VGHHGSHPIRIDRHGAGPVGRGRRLVMRSRVQGNNVTKWPPITRQYARSAGEFVVSLPLARLRNNLRKSLILLARPRRFELLTFAFGGQRSPRGLPLQPARSSLVRAHLGMAARDAAHRKAKNAWPANGRALADSHRRGGIDAFFRINPSSAPPSPKDRVKLGAAGGDRASI
jgi:hypothetical protein